MKKLISMILVLTLVFALAACGGKDAASGSADASGSGDKVEEVKSVDLQAFYESTFVGEDMPMMGVMEGEALDAFYPGLSALELKQCIAAMPMIMQVAAEVVMVEVSDPADLEKVKDIFQARIDYQVKEQGAWYPASIEVWEKNSEIVTNGNTVMLIVMDPKDGVVEAFNALFA